MNRQPRTLLTLLLVPAIAGTVAQRERELCGMPVVEVEDIRLPWLVFEAVGDRPAEPLKADAVVGVPVDAFASEPSTSLSSSTGTPLARCG